MKQIIAVGLIVVGLLIGTVATAASSYGKQFTRGTMIGVIENSNPTELYKIQDGNTTCYIAQFGKSGVSLSCVR